MNPQSAMPSPQSRVLIVDDEKSIRRTLGEFLREAGYAVAEAEDADAAMAHLRAGDFDVVVTDIVLPRVTGVELLRRIQGLAPEVQVVMMTGEPTVETATEALRLGAADYLFKPINKAAILRATGNAARIKTLEDTRRRLEAENQAHRENLERLVAERTTQLRQSEARAQDLSRFNQAALDALTAHICVLAEDGTILAVNRAWTEFLRDNPPPARNADVGANYLAVCDAVVGDDAPSAQDAVAGLRAVVRGELPEFSLEYACPSPDQPRWFLLRATRFGGEGPVRIVVAHVNITQRKLAEEALWAERNLLRTLVDSLPVAAYAKDRAGRKTLVNPVDAYNLGVASPREALGKTDFDFFPREAAERFVADDQAVLRDGQPVLNREERITRRDGSTGWLLTSKVPLRDADGRITGLVGIGLDITQRRQFEEQLRKLARAVEQSPASIIITDCAGNIEFVNPKFTQVTGYTADEVAGKNPRILKSGETPVEEYRRLWEVIAAGQEWRGEFRNKRKDGTLFWETASISPIRDGGGKITHFIAVKEDVTEKKLTEAKFLRAQRVESIGSLASGIAHDLNNILTPIILCAPLLELDEGPQTRKALAHTVETSAQRAVGIVKQLLSFARGKEGQKQSVQVRHLVRDMAKIARETFPRSIQVQEECAADLWTVSADATQIHQVLLNLCVNARDAMPHGGKLMLRGENVTLDEHYVSMHQEASPGPFVRIQVEDTGTGIPEEVQDRIFESFFTTKGEGEGTGLGLTTVQGIVKDHKGFLTFKSEAGKGTAFVIHLPAVRETKADTEVFERREEPPQGQGELVLIVDDEPAICETTRRTLERHGYAVLHAGDGIEGLARFSAQQKNVRVVVTDFMMPLMDGVTLSRALRALSPELPIVVSSGGLFGKAGGEALRAYKELGIRHILHKPHTAEVLLRTLGEILRPPAGKEPRS